MVLRGENAIKPFLAAFDAYWQNDRVLPGLARRPPQNGPISSLDGIDARVAFSPHAPENALLEEIADDIGEQTTSSLFYSLAFLSQTPGPILDAIGKVTRDDGIFVYGISDKEVGGLDLQKPDGNVAPVSSAELAENVPEPFKSEPAGGSGIRMHHKFVVIDFDKPTARVYLGSYNFSSAADKNNGENLLLVRDRRIAVSYMIEALRIFDHYHFRVAQEEATRAVRQLALATPPRSAEEEPWWAENYTVASKIRDRELFA